MDVYYLVSVAIKNLRQDGYRPSSHVLGLQEEFKLGALEVKDELSKRRHGDVAELPIAAGCSIGSAEASEILGISRRQVQRLAKTLGGRRGHAGVLMFDVHEITAYGAARLAA